MKGVHTLWSGPRAGVKVGLSQLEILLLASSVAEWRRWHGPAVLYCDGPFERYLEQIDLLELWDHIDLQTLNEPTPPEIDASTFWTYGRLLAISDVTPPFVSIDCDLVMWRNFKPTFAESDITFTHWEATNDSPWYPPTAHLSLPSSYRIDPSRDWTLRASNVSSAHFGERTARLRDRYVDEFLRVATNSSARSRPELGVAPELLFAEQRLLPILAAEEELTSRPLIDTTWSPRHDRFLADDSHQNPWNPLAVAEQPTGITHAWFHKRFMKSGDGVHDQMVLELSTCLVEEHPRIAERLISNGFLRLNQ